MIGKIHLLPGCLRRFLFSYSCAAFVFILPLSSVFADEKPGELLAGVVRNFPPHYSVDKNTGQPTGFAVEVMDEIAKRAGLNVRYILFDEWASTLRALREGRIDFIPNLGITRERKKEFDFTRPLEAFQIRIFVRATTTNIKTVDDLQGRTVAVVAENIGDFIIQEYGKAKPILFQSLEEALLSLLSGNADALIYPEPPVLFLAHNSDFDDHIRTAGEPLQEVKRAMAVARGKTELLHKLDEAVKLFVRTTEYKEIYARWHHPPEPYWNSRRIVILIGILIVLAIVIFGGWHYISLKSLNRELQDSIEKQRKSEELFKVIASSSPDHLLVQDNELRYKFVMNPQLGLTEKDMIGKTDYDLFSREEADKLSQIKEEMLKSGRPLRAEVSLNSPEGEQYFDGYYVPKFDEKGQTDGLIGYLRNVTERKQAAEALRKSEEDAKRLAEENALVAEMGRIIGSTPNIEEVFDRFSEEVAKLIPFERIQINVGSLPEDDSYVRYVSGIDVPRRRVGERVPLTGTATIECFRTKASLLLQPKDAKEVEELGARYPKLLPNLQAGVRSAILVPLIAGDTTIGVLSLRTTQTQAYTEQDVRLAESIASQIAGAVANAQLYEERTQAEKEKEKLQMQFLQAQKMESVGRLAGGVAHDFNNKLAVIMGYAEMALMKLDSGGSIESELEEILKAAQHSADLTRQLLAFARRQTVSPKVVDLNDLISGMLKMLRRLIGEDIELAWMPGHELWKLKIDPSQIDQILANLTVNSRDAISGAGKVVLKAENAVLDGAYCADHTGCVPGEYVLLEVSDTGAGMGKEVMEHLFEPFFTTKGMGKGTGLGLATVYGIIQQNNGFIDVESEAGRGTLIRIYLPRFQAESAEATPEKAAKIVRGGTETVMIVEDEEAILDLGKAILEKLGYHVLAARSPEEAMDTAESYASRIDLLITDVVMPVMNGRELMEKLGILKPGLKGLYMSGYTADVIAHHAVLEEGVHFMPKPFAVQDLAAKVHEVLDGPR